MSIREPAYVYLNFEDYNGGLEERDANFENQSRTGPILERASDYIVAVVGFSIPPHELASICRFEIRTNSIPVVATLSNGNNQKQSRVLLTYYPSLAEIDLPKITYNSSNYIYHSMDSNEQLRMSDIQIVYIANDGTENAQKLESGEACCVQLQFTRVGQVYSQF